ncbi:GGDEF domain-containing protein [Cohnella soli]|uniref:GGDEF domain-containing protein n=1 Tax=Cohnella soli TaxID=425005 RepID=A0ABW0HPJ1_9BACL
MRYRFGMILTITMIVFAIAVSLLFSITSYLKLRDQAIQNNREQVRQNELIANNALETIEKAYNAFGSNIVAEMKKRSYYLLDLYDQQPDFGKWNLDALEHQLSFDIYIIDSSNVIRYSNLEADIGLDFHECCPTFSGILDARRESGTFYYDGVDVQQKTGELKKYSYIATRDHKYLIELGYSLEQGTIFNEFNFFDVIAQFVKQSPSIDEINVLSADGTYYGTSGKHELKISPVGRPFFERALRSGQATEYKGEWGNEPATYRYVQYHSQYDQGATKIKVLEIISNENGLQAILAKEKKAFFNQLIIMIVVAIGISYVLSKWVARPLYYAFHDSLTGLKNRAAFDNLLESALARTKGFTALMMIDLDNFKLVNDAMGHDEGDILLKNAAQCILRGVDRKKGIKARWGGDEFVVAIPHVSQEEAERVASRIIESITELVSREVRLAGGSVGVSIGIALYPVHGEDKETLLKKADIALYAAKEQGKNQYLTYRSQA